MLLEQAEPDLTLPCEASDAPSAVRQLFETLHPQERAAILMKDVLELWLEETAAMLHTTVGRQLAQNRTVRDAALSQSVRTCVPFLTPEARD